ncbi:MAG TPA: hypothetical protein VHY80_09175 [Stellaceae bacterium]|nr:hypothetical protein [Stellaceae bacterium]
MSGITAYLEGLVKIDEGQKLTEGLRGGRAAKSQAFAFPNKNSVASDPHSQLMSVSMRMRIILNQASA